MVSVWLQEGMVSDAIEQNANITVTEMNYLKVWEVDSKIK